MPSPTYTYKRSFSLQAPVEQVFPFFAHPANLLRCAPPSLHLKIPSPPEKLHQGCVMEMQMRAFGVPVRWRSMIVRWEPPFEFVDEQMQGPWESWQHTHSFRQVGERTLVEDAIAYRPPWGLAGRLLLPLMQRQMRAFFEYRQACILSLVRTPEKAPAS